jgi:hypothetical protein
LTGKGKYRTRRRKIVGVRAKQIVGRNRYVASSLLGEREGGRWVHRYRLGYGTTLFLA